MTKDEGNLRSRGHVQGSESLQGGGHSQGGTLGWRPHLSMTEQSGPFSGHEVTALHSDAFLRSSCCVGKNAGPDLL